MKATQASGIAACLLLAAACASPTKEARRNAANAAASAEAQEGLVFGQLPEGALPQGACGMVLWTLEDQSPQPVFRFVAGKKGEAIVNGEQRIFALADMSGRSRYGVSERQDFVSDTGLSLSVSVRFGLGFDGGNYLERGLMAIEDASGWRTVAPVAGLAGCRSS